MHAESTLDWQLSLDVKFNPNDPLLGLHARRFVTEYGLPLRPSRDGQTSHKFPTIITGSQPTVVRLFTSIEDSRVTHIH